MTEEPREEPDPKAAYLGPFRLLKRVATGGMAEIFAARVAGPTGLEGMHEGQLVALKRLLPGLGEEDDVLEMFLSEAKLSSKLTHDHIARCYGMSHAPGTSEPFLVLEFVRGVDLGDALRAQLADDGGSPVPSDVLTAIAVQTVTALAYVHGLTDDSGQPLRVIHRDISPQNLRLRPDGVLKVLDFGIARYVGRSTDTMAGVLKGKHAYMSPEQVEGLHLDARSDLFSLGVLLYELATGSRLFRADTVPDTLNRVRLCEVPDLAQRRPDLDPSLVETIMGCLSRDPDGRPDDAASLVQWGETLIAGGLPEAHEILARWFVEIFGPEHASETIEDEIGAYYASLVSAEDKGEETTDQIGVPDATRVYRVGTDPPPRAPDPLPGQARWLLYAMAVAAVACVAWMLW